MDKAYLNRAYLEDIGYYDNEEVFNRINQRENDERLILETLIPSGEYHPELRPEYINGINLFGEKELKSEDQ